MNAQTENAKAPGVDAPEAPVKAETSASLDTYEDIMIALGIATPYLLLMPGPVVYLLPAPRFNCYACEDTGIIEVRDSLGRTSLAPCACAAGQRMALAEACAIYDAEIVAPAEQGGHAPEVVSPVEALPDVLAPWLALLPESRALLRELVDAGGRMSVNGTSEKALRELADGLLIFRFTADRAAVITDSGARLVKAAGEWWTPERIEADAELYDEWYRDSHEY